MTTYQIVFVIVALCVGLWSVIEHLISENGLSGRKTLVAVISFSFYLILIFLFVSLCYSLEGCPEYEKVETPLYKLKTE